MRMVGNVACIGEIKNVYKIWAGKPEGRRQVGRPRCRWEGNIKMNFKEIGWEGLVGLD
jgi:hypothetical protein